MNPRRHHPYRNAPSQRRDANQERSYSRNPPDINLNASFRPLPGSTDSNEVRNALYKHHPDNSQVTWRAQSRWVPGPQAMAPDIPGEVGHASFDGDITSPEPDHNFQLQLNLGPSNMFYPTPGDPGEPLDTSLGDGGYPYTHTWQAPTEVAQASYQPAGIVYQGDNILSPQDSCSASANQFAPSSNAIEYRPFPSGDMYVDLSLGHPEDSVDRSVGIGYPGNDAASNNTTICQHLMSNLRQA
ncbi:hypothetical protein IAT40_003289 [Kwoniella sp. CBS 6097]